MPAPRFVLDEFWPSDLFLGGIPGAWYDPTDLSTMFQDSAGVTPVTAVEQPVGRILDKSGNANHASQSTAASRPTYRARYNLVEYSEQLNNAYWFKAGGTVTANSTVAPDGTTTADTWTATAGSARHELLSAGGAGPATIANQNYTFTLYVKKGTHNYISLLVTANNTTWYVATFDFSGATPVVSQTGAGAGGTLVSTSIEAAANGFWRIGVTGRKTDAVACVAPVLASSATPTYGIYGEENWTAAGTETAIFWGAQLLSAADVTATGNAYQRIEAATVYDTAPIFRPYLAFDGIDDSLATAAIDFTGTNKMTVFVGVTKGSDAALGTVTELGNRNLVQAGSFTVNAPRTAGNPNYGFTVEGTAVTNNTIVTYTAPITNVMTARGDIAAPLNELRVNGAVAGTVTTTLGTGNFGNWALNIGRRNNTNLPFNGRIYSLIVRGAASSVTEIADTELWVNACTGAF